MTCPHLYSHEYTSQNDAAEQLKGLSARGRAG